MFDKNIQLGYDTWKNLADKNIVGGFRKDLRQRRRSNPNRRTMGILRRGVMKILSDLEFHELDYDKEES